MKTFMLFGTVLKNIQALLVLVKIEKKTPETVNGKQISLYIISKIKLTNFKKRNISMYFVVDNILDNI
jgi:hypothetical protein